MGCSLMIPAMASAWFSTMSATQVLDSMSVPAVVQNGRLDLLAANDLGRALYADLFTMAQQPPNFARYVFLDPRAEDFYADLDEAKDLLVAVLRATAGRDPLDKQVTALVGELSARSTGFGTRRAKHDVHRHSRGRKVVHHPAVGTMDLAYDDFALPGEPLRSLLLASRGLGPAVDVTICDLGAGVGEKGGPGRPRGHGQTPGVGRFTLPRGRDGSTRPHY
ncbi:hypothetical protein [Streptomyces sp. Ru73]|uniref:MmyB family transcriptional regulator n=1 Tax=Streptomyces sp. Ru73 TaxID=2080748 RepID=UPI0027E5975C|nr:hypothetical protein [Streptomyces sp. Ru73]